jgi:excisionase family DNA binding protein
MEVRMGSFQALAVCVEEAAKLAGVGRTEIYRAIKQRELASLKVGKRRLVRVEALKRWLESLEARTA